MALAVNAVVALCLRPYFGFLSAAYGATFAGWAMLVCLWWGSRKFGEAAHLEPTLRAKVGRIFLASFMMGAVVWGITALMSPVLQMSGYRVPALLIILVVGLGSYVLAGRITGAFTVGELRRKLRD